jgi:hypothetical protein
MSNMQRYNTQRYNMQRYNTRRYNTRRYDTRRYSLHLEERAVKLQLLVAHHLRSTQEVSPPLPPQA